jgi:putative transposase
MKLSGDKVTNGRKTCVRWDTPGHAHFLTFSCFRNQLLLSRDRSRQWFLEALDDARRKHRFRVWAYVVMPEHAHVLIFVPRASYSVSRILSSIKLPVSRKAIAFVRSEAPAFLTKMEDRQPNGTCHLRFWQRGGGFDENIVEPELVWKVIDYIHANPIRRGLCKTAMEWAWSSENDSLGILDRSLMPRMGGG